MLQFRCGKTSYLSSKNAGAVSCPFLSLRSPPHKKSKVAEPIVLKLCLVVRQSVAMNSYPRFIILIFYAFIGSMGRSAPAIIFDGIFGDLKAHGNTGAFRTFMHCVQCQVHRVEDDGKSTFSMLMSSFGKTSSLQGREWGRLLPRFSVGCTLLFTKKGKVARPNVIKQCQAVVEVKRERDLGR